MRPTLVLLVLIAALCASSSALAVDNPDFRTLINDIRAYGDPNERPLLASAEASQRAFVRGNYCAALGALGALENKLNARGGVDDPNIRPILADINQVRSAIEAIAIDDPNIRPGCIEDPNI